MWLVELCSWQQSIKPFIRTSMFFINSAGIACLEELSFFFYFLLGMFICLLILPLAYGLRVFTYIFWVEMSVHDFSFPYVTHLKEMSNGVCAFNQSRVSWAHTVIILSYIFCCSCVVVFYIVWIVCVCTCRERILVFITWLLVWFLYLYLYVLFWLLVC